MIIAVAIALILAGCGGAGSSGNATSGSSNQSSKTAAGSGGAAIKTIMVKETEYKLDPSKIVLSKPGTYAFKAEDKGKVQHSLEVEGKGVKGEEHEAKLKSILNPGQSSVLRVTFTKPGTYEIYCPVDGHKQLGMKGEVVVK